MKRAADRFAEKFLSKIGKIDPARVRDYLVEVLSKKDFLEQIFRHLDEGTIVTDGSMRIIFSNEMAREMLHWPSGEQYFGEDLADHCPQGELKKILRNMRKRPRAIQGHEIVAGPEGKTRWILNAIPMESPPERMAEDEQSGPLWVVLLHDVTERFQTIEEHSRAQRLASLGLLTAGVAHEIKNPLNSLHIHAQILLDQSEDEDAELDREKVARAARVILEETDRMTDIVNEFIQAARPQAPILQKDSLNGVCEDLARVFEPECRARGIEFTMDLDADLPRIMMDKNLIFQALRNLVRNAIEAHSRQDEVENEGEGESGDSEKQILLRTKLAGDTAAIEVADNGPGIEEDRVKRIFEPYYSTKFDGTGLGLMVVYRVVTEHQGSIRVDSRPGVGTQFVIILPLSERPVRLLEEPQSDKAPAPAAARS